MDTIFVLIAAKPWLVTAACDFVTVIAAVGIAVVILGRRPRVSAPLVTPEPARPAAPEVAIPRGIRTAAADPGRSTVLPGGLSGSRRSAINDAMAAMERWESTYRGTGRGLDDLTRLAQKRQQGVTQELLKVQR